MQPAGRGVAAHLEEAGGSAHEPDGDSSTGQGVERLAALGVVHGHQGGCGQRLGPGDDDSDGDESGAPGGDGSEDAVQRPAETDRSPAGLKNVDDDRHGAHDDGDGRHDKRAAGEVVARAPRHERSTPFLMGYGESETTAVTKAPRR